MLIFPGTIRLWRIPQCDVRENAKKERREKVNGFFANKEEKAGGKKKEVISSFFPFSMPLGHFYGTLRGWCDKKEEGRGAGESLFWGSMEERKRKSFPSEFEQCTSREMGNTHLA